MAVLEVRLFGKFRVRCKGCVVGDLDASKVQEMFSYLLLARGRPHSREILAEKLWSDSSAAQSRKYLRQALWQLQSALEDHREPMEGSVLMADADWVGINSEADLWVDVADFEQACLRVNGVSGGALDAQGAHTLQRAAELYQGDLLENCYQDWCLYERERLQNMHLSLLDKLMGYHEGHRDFEAGLMYGALILRFDRARERTHRRLMRLHYLAGDRTGALRQYQQCVAALREELDVEPAKSTVALYEQIRADDVESPRTVNHASAPGSVAPLASVRDHLEQLQSTLAHLECAVRQDIDTVESLLQDQR
jgi:DNA-binding SARP family transcriptional activator